MAVCHSNTYYSIIPLKLQTVVLEKTLESP